MKCVFAQKDMINTILSCSKPADLKALMKYLQKETGDVRALKNKDPKFTNHVNTIADGLSLFAWFAAVSFEILNNRYRVMLKNICQRLSQALISLDSKCSSSNKIKIQHG